MIVDGEEIFFVPYDCDTRKRLLYAPLRSFLAIVPECVEVWCRALDNAENETRLASVLARMRKKPRIDIQRLHEILRKGAPELSVAITDNCNLRCHYCHHAAGSQAKRGSMSRDMISGLLEHFLKTAVGPEVCITFAGGGEPTFDLRLLEFAIKSAREEAGKAGVDVSFRMATNGCYGPSVWQFIKGNFAEISLSFDGPPFIQNLHRPYPGGKESFAHVYDTARHFYESRFPFAFRATVSDFSCDHLREVVDFFAREFPGKSLGLEPLNPYGRAEVDKTVNPPDKGRFARALVDAYRFAEGKQVKLISASVGKFETLRTIFCGAVGIPNWTVGTDGAISCCTRENAPEVFKFGRFDNTQGSFVTEETKLTQIRKMNVFSYGECHDCFCKYHCAGDCPDLRLSGLHNCAANKTMGSYWLHKKIEEARLEK
jgi:uncharacterized protein